MVSGSCSWEVSGAGRGGLSGGGPTTGGWMKAYWRWKLNSTLGGAESDRREGLEGRGWSGSDERREGDEIFGSETVAGCIELLGLEDMFV